MKSTKELQIGDWVYDEGGFPMFVQALFDDDTVYLDFDGNEADTWETDIEDVKPIPITEDLLVKNGFAYNSQNDLLMWYDGCGHIHITIRERYCYVGYNGKRLYTSIQYVHELQHIMRFCKIEKKIEL